MLIEVVVRDYLQTALDNVPVSTEYPHNAKGRFIVLDMTGQSRSDCLYSCSMAVQSYGDTKTEAAELDEAVKRAMLVLQHKCVHVSGCELNSSYPFPDLQRKKDRYQSVFYINHY